MIRRSPIKSPMQKLSNVGNKIATRGSQLIDSASSAVAQGTHLSSVVASKANAKAEEIATQVRSPDKKRTSRSGGGKGIRDRINKFDSASKKGNMEYHSTTPYRQGRTSRESTSTYTSTNTHRRSRGGDVYEAETMMPPACNPSFYAKENDEPNNQNEALFDSGAFASKEYGGKSPIRRKKNRKKREGATSPAKPNYPENEVEVVEGDDTRATRSNSNHYETETERNQSRESRNGYDRRQKNGQHTNIENVDIADLNRAAIFQSSSKDRVTNNHRSHAAVPRTNNHHHNTNTSSVVMSRIKKREKADHPLIASPLRKHMRGVHDSASSNATCTLLKDPFPLLPPKCDRPLAAVAHWEREERNGAGSGSSLNGGGMGHLGTLGSVTGTLKASGVQRANRGEGGATSSASGDRANTKNGEEDALDLLTSAAFMFKHSRRNLG